MPRDIEAVEIFGELKKAGVLPRRPRQRGRTVHAAAVVAEGKLDGLPCCPLLWRCRCSVRIWRVSDWSACLVTSQLWAHIPCGFEWTTCQTLNTASAAHSVRTCDHITSQTQDCY